MCTECESYEWELMLRGCQLLATPVCETARLETLCAQIDKLEAAYVEHQQHHCRYWEPWPRVVAIIDTGRMN